ncbi:RNI-like protein, partial [Gloeophyllum trabeum ATCC 11539]
GVKDIIKDIRSRRVVTKLILGHNDLGDDGCITLFDYLCSEEGRGYRIEEISLNSNNIGDRGLAAIADYLRDNHALKSLLLQGNAFRGDPEVVTRFAEALNSSSLEMLSLATNTFLSDPFISRFLPALHARHLRELHLTLLNITNRSMDPLIHYLISPHCRLRTLRLNGNSLGAHAVGQIIRAVTVSNYNLTRLEMLGNFSPVPGPGPDGVLDEREFNALAQWPAREKELKRVMERNDYLARMREKEALSLLVLARRVLLRSRRSDAESLVPQQDATSMPRLPTELKLHIMSLAAPRLSNAQCLRIFAYAADPETLP